MLRNLGLQQKDLVLLHRELLVPLLDLLGDVVCEGISDESVDDVGDVAPWQPVTIPGIWPVLLRDGMLGCELEERLDAQPGVGRAGDVLDLVGLDV